MSNTLLSKEAFDGNIIGDRLLKILSLENEPSKKDEDVYNFYHQLLILLYEVYEDAYRTGDEVGYAYGHKEGYQEGYNDADDDWSHDSTCW